MFFINNISNALFQWNLATSESLIPESQLQNPNTNANTNTNTNTKNKTKKNKKVKIKKQQKNEIYTIPRIESNLKPDIWWSKNDQELAKMASTIEVDRLIASIPDTASTQDSQTTLTRRQAANILYQPEDPDNNFVF